MKSLLLGLLFGISVAVHAKGAVVGCYSVFIAEPNEPPAQLKRPVHLLREKDIRLTSKHATTPWTGNSAFQVVPVVSSDKFNYLGAYWILKKEELSIIWSNTGLSGVQMTLTSTANGFEGIIEDFWDFEPFTTNKRRAILTRRPC